MASYTEHYHLHQWTPEDAFLRTDFNTDLSAIDQALGTLGAAAAFHGNCEMELLAFVGTGTYGQGNVKTITFTTKPDIYLIAGYNTLILGQGTSNAPLMIAEDVISGPFIKSTDVTWSGNTLSIMNTVSAQYQMNMKSKQYWALGLHIKTK